jgi:hypothetical protein
MGPQELLVQLESKPQEQVAQALEPEPVLARELAYFQQPVPEEFSLLPLAQQLVLEPGEQW